MSHVAWPIRAKLLSCRVEAQEAEADDTDRGVRACRREYSYAPPPQVERLDQAEPEQSTATVVQTHEQVPEPRGRSNCDRLRLHLLQHRREAGLAARGRRRDDSQ